MLVSIYIGNNYYGLESKEPGRAFPSRVAHQGHIQIIAALAIAVASVHYADDKLSEIDDKILVLCQFQT